MSQANVREFHISEPEWFKGEWWACLDSETASGVWACSLTKNGVIRHLMWFARRWHERWWDGWLIVWAPGHPNASVEIETY